MLPPTSPLDPEALKGGATQPDDESSVDGAGRADAGDETAALATQELGVSRRRHLPAPANRDRQYAQYAAAESTKKSYKADLSLLVQWCTENGLSSALPIDSGVIAEFLYVMSEAKMAVATITRAVTGINKAHTLAGFASPSADVRVKEAIRRIRRFRGVKQVRKDAITLSELRSMVAAIVGNGLRQKLERAVLLVTWWAALRRSETAALKFSEVKFQAEGVIVTVSRSKSDQTGEGADIGLIRTKDVSVCPITALQEWLTASGISDGMLFRSVGRRGMGKCLEVSGKSIARLVKRLALIIGLDASRFSGHSLRSGFVTEAIAQQREPVVIRKTTRHESAREFEKYIRGRDVFAINAAKGMA